MTPPLSDSSRTIWIPSLIAVLAVAIAMRGFIIGDAFWLDEIWSWSRLPKLQSIFDVFTHEDLHLDNNHLLITMWMYALGDQDNWVLYRLPSLLAGLVSVVLVVEPRQGPRGVLIPGGVFALSMFLTLYSTEARGYALASCFALIGYRILARREAESFALSRVEAIAFPITVLLAVCGHLIALHFYLGALVWTAVHTLGRLGLRAGVRRLIWLHGAASALLFGLWIVFVRHVEVGGGTSLPIKWVLQNALAWLSGAPNELVVAVPAALVLLALAGVEAWHRSRVGSSQWVFLLTTVLLAPTAILLVYGTQGILYARYFLVAATFVLLFASRTLVRWHAGSGSKAWAAIAVLVLFAVGNGVRYAKYIRGGGRGQYLAAVQQMSKQSPGQFGVGADHDFRIGVVLQYYQRFLPAGQVMGFLVDAPLDPQGPDWFLVHNVWNPESQWPQPQPRSVITLTGAAFELVGTFPHYGPSGITWFLYRRR